MWSLYCCENSSLFRCASTPLRYILPPISPFSSISVLTITQPQAHQNSYKQRPTQSDSGLKAFYCSSRLLYVQKRWPAKTFLVGGDTEPQIDCCFLDTNVFFFTVQSITTTKYMLLPLQKGPGKCGTVRVKTNSSLIYLHNFHVVYLITDAKCPPQMGTATSNTRVTSSKLIRCSDHLSLTDWSRWVGALKHSFRFSSIEPFWFSKVDLIWQVFSNGLMVLLVAQIPSADQKQSSKQAISITYMHWWWFYVPASP